MRNVTVGQYVPGDSPVHALDPRVKVVLLALAMTTTFSVSSPYAVLALLVLTLAGAIAARLPLGYFLGGLRTVGLLIAMTTVFNLLLVHGGRPLFTLGPVTIDTHGARMAFLLASRLVLLMLLTSLFTLTTSPIRMTDALERLLSPLRRIGVPTAEIAMMTSIALRFIPTLVETAERIMKAQLARGARFGEGGAISRARALVPVLVPLFVTSFGAAEDLATAMEARCYRGGRGRTRMISLQMHAVDLAAVALVGTLLCAVVWTEALGLLP